MKKKLFALAILAIRCTGDLIMTSCNKDGVDDVNTTDIDNSTKKPFKPGKAWLAAYLNIDIERIVYVEYMQGAYHQETTTRTENGHVRTEVAKWGCDPANQTCRIIVHTSGHAGLNSKNGNESGLPCGYMVILDDEIILMPETLENGGPEWMLTSIYDNGETPIEGAEELGLCNPGQYVVIPPVCVQATSADGQFIIRIPRNILEIRNSE